MIRSILFLLTGMFVLSCLSCTKEKGAATAAEDICDTIYYATQIKPMIDAKCIGCHTTGFSGGDLTTYAGIKAKVDNGTLYQAVVVNKTMPQNDTLSPANIKKIKCWINAGAPQN